MVSKRVFIFHGSCYCEKCSTNHYYIIIELVVLVFCEELCQVTEKKQCIFRGNILSVKKCLDKIKLGI